MQEWLADHASFQKSFGLFIPIFKIEATCYDVVWFTSFYHVLLQVGEFLFGVMHLGSLGQTISLSGQAHVTSPELHLDHRKGEEPREVTARVRLRVWTWV